MDLHGRSTVKTRHGAGSTANRFIVLVSGITETEIIIVLWAAAMTPKAPNRTLVTPWLVSMLPATTAAG